MPAVMHLRPASYWDAPPAQQCSLDEPFDWQYHVQHRAVLRSILYITLQKGLPEPMTSFPAQLASFSGVHCHR